MGKIMKLIQILFIFLSVKESFELEIWCQINNYAWHTVGFLQTCEVSTFSKVHISAITLVNGSKESINTVKGIHFLHGSENLKFIPKNMLDFFPNLIAIDFSSTNISEISSNDLKAYTDLVYFSIFDSKISVIPGDVFKYNEKLKYVSFAHNFLLKHVGENLFENLKQLQRANFGKSNCIDLYAGAPDSLKVLIKDLNVKCKLDDFKNLKNTTVEQKIIEKLRKSITDQEKTIKNQEAMIESFKEEIEDLKQRINELEHKESNPNIWFF